MAGDVAELIGQAAQKVENRSLLLDKYVFHKRWPLERDSHGGEIKWDDASRWSFMRIAEGAGELLNREAGVKRYRAGGQNVGLDNRERLLAEAQLAESLAKISWDTKELATLRARHTRRFLSLFQRHFSQKNSVVIAQLEGRLAINLADSLIQNAGICLDRLFGLPYIPGSAVKGVCRHAALEELKSTSGHGRNELFDLFYSIFGTSDNDFTNGELRPFKHLLAQRSENQKGAIAFLPAYPVNEAKVVVDLTNVHYPEYYRTGRMEELSNEQLRPNPFPAVETGAQFAFCLVLNGVDQKPELLKQAGHWLETAITIRGLGAKTGAGYGWFSLQPEVLQQLLEEERREAETLAAKVKAESEAKTRADAEEKRRASLSPEELAFETLPQLADEAFAAFARNLADKPEPDQRAFLRLLREHKDKRDRWKTWKKKKPDLATVIEAVRQKLNAPALP
jgi:CRISPR type III-B/RAMP module RAMP protein Cmr6